jgi:hypothetical protein
MVVIRVGEEETIMGLKVYGCPKGYEIPEFNFDSKNWQKDEADHTARLAKHLRESGHLGETGGTFALGVADGSAQYMFVEGGGRFGKRAFLIHLAYGDGYSYYGVENFPKSEILRMIKQGKARENLFKKAKDWWDAREVGEIVHYSNGFGSYVRGEIVEGEVHGEQGKAMKEIALVGNWRNYDLPSRYIDGTIHYGIHAEGVREGKVIRPHESNMYEAVISQKDANSRELAARHPEDPRKMTPISLEVPEMTAEEAELARLFNFRAEIIDTLSDRDSDNYTPPTAEVIRAQLAAVLKMVEGEVK